MVIPTAFEGPFPLLLLPLIILVHVEAESANPNIHHYFTPLTHARYSPARLDEHMKFGELKVLNYLLLLQAKPVACPFQLQAAKCFLS